MRIHMVAAAIVLLAVPGCRLDRRTELLENQYLVARLDNTAAAQQHLEEELQRELLHVDRLERELERLLTQEESLAIETTDMELVVEEALAELEELELEAEEIARQGGEKMAQIEADRARLVAVRESGDRARIEAAVAELRGELDLLEAALAALPAAEPATPEPTAPVPEGKDAPPPDDG